MTNEDIQYWLDTLAEKKTARSQFDNVWQEIRDYMLPNRPSFTSVEVKGKKTMDKIKDGTAIYALNVCKAGINGMLTNAALPWHGIETTDHSLNSEPAMREALQEVNDIMPVEYHNSNFYTNIDGIYEEVIGFGQSGLFIGEGKSTALNFIPVALRDCYIDTNSEGKVDTLLRVQRMTARQAEQSFETLTPRMNEILRDRKTDKEFEVLHVVCPRKDRELDKKGNYKKDNMNKAFASFYIATEEKKVLEEGGYDEFPYAVPRLFAMSGDEYGRGLGWNALPDTKMLNTMETTGIRAWQKATDPPVVLPDEGFSLPVRVGPGGVNYNSNWDKPGSEARSLYGAGSFQQLPSFEQKCEQKRAQIREFFFYKQFSTQQEGQPRTASEIIQIASENLKILGPLLNRFMEELLKPVIIRSFWILYRAGKFPKLRTLVESSQNPIEFKIVYLSPIAKAQRLYEAQELQNAFGLIMPVAQVKPELLDNISGDKFFSVTSELYPAVLKIAETPADVKKIRKTRAEEALRAQGMQEIGGMLEGAKTASETDPNEGLLGALSGNIGL